MTKPSPAVQMLHAQARAAYKQHNSPQTQADARTQSALAKAHGSEAAAAAYGRTRA